jgi:hypothetical protein
VAVSPEPGTYVEKVRPPEGEKRVSVASSGTIGGPILIPPPLEQQNVGASAPGVTVRPPKELFPRSHADPFPSVATATGFVLLKYVE